MTTLIIGYHSNLTHELLKTIPNARSISSRELTDDIERLSPFKDQSINLIFNNFQTATQLNDTAHIDEYIENSIHITAKVLAYFNETTITKIIYTSSSSVYGNNIFCDERDEVKPRSLHAALKVSNEKLIEKYAQNRLIDYTIARIFNMFGGNDTFSIISKIFTAYTLKETLTIINNGNAIRDFIHIETVVEVYQRLLTTPNIPIINIGSGRGTSIRNVLDFLKNHGFILQTTTISADELKISTADNSVMVNLLEHDTFIDAESYLLERLKSNS